ncbi:btb/poz-like protein [Grosmannia clavigera kw1407]|uniref:Btb/poz-like protein n=1 Tax=Grosmannia clavigera (strain kw1407 / UAMH 11150) TaxID=655863 RepID=F0XJH5_GROCL|nr:btb/poz-like protein [Grosmannia clavigera kw1407]EFX02354.1 btb/poz-like protein [Grosmannia clavigera kw1407]
MFKRAFRSQAAAPTVDPQRRVDKSARLAKRSGGGGAGGPSGGSFSTRDSTHKLSRLQRSLSQMDGQDEVLMADGPSSRIAAPPSPIVTLTVGREGRLFAAHEDVLCQSPFFEALFRRSSRNKNSNSPDVSTTKRIVLPEEEPEIFSAVLEYLYKGDYYPRLVHSHNGNAWELEDSTPTPETSPPTAVEPTVFLASMGQHLLRDTVVYCAADRYGLEELKRLALRKQGLQSGIDVATILRSAQYCYGHTPDSDSRLRAHYLALIIRCRKTFKRSGTMQAEMERSGEGGKLFFDLFVALCNHLDDVIDASNARTPRTI